jgi:hypothetical protein
MKTKIFKAFINKPVAAGAPDDNLDTQINKFVEENNVEIIDIKSLCPVADSQVDSKTMRMFVLLIYKEKKAKKEVVA